MFRRDGLGLCWPWVIMVIITKRNSLWIYFSYWALSTFYIYPPGIKFFGNVGLHDGVLWWKRTKYSFCNARFAVRKRYMSKYLCCSPSSYNPTGVEYCSALMDGFGLLALKPILMAQPVGSSRCCYWSDIIPGPFWLCAYVSIRKHVTIRKESEEKAAITREPTYQIRANRVPGQLWFRRRPATAAMSSLHDWVQFCVPGAGLVWRHSL